MNNRPWKIIALVIVAAALLIAAKYFGIQQGVRRMLQYIHDLGPWAPLAYIGFYAVACIFAITDDRNSPAPAGLAPVVVGLLVVLIGAAFGFNAGYAINPARDFGPRLFTSVAGWGAEVFRAAHGWWWVPIVAPSIGGVIGGGVYDAFIGKRFVEVRIEKSEVRT